MSYVKFSVKLSQNFIWIFPVIAESYTERTHLECQLDEHDSPWQRPLEVVWCGATRCDLLRAVLRQDKMAQCHQGCRTHPCLIRVRLLVRNDKRVIGDDDESLQLHFPQWT